MLQRMLAMPAAVGRLRACVTVALMTLLLLHTASNVRCDNPADPNDQRDVFLELSFLEITKVDGVEQVFYADFYFTSFWYDPNITAGSDTFPTDGWAPQLEFINRQAGSDTLYSSDSSSISIVDTPSFIANDPVENAKWPAVIAGQQGTWLRDDNRYAANFFCVIDMHSFPFDRQNVTISMESAKYDITGVRLRPAGAEAAQLAIRDISASEPNPFQVIGWDLTGSPSKTRFETMVYNYPALGQDYSRLNIKVELLRQPAFYMTKIVVGVILLVYMCIWVFALQVDEADRMMGTLQVFAGLITYLFVAAGDTPKVPYQTRLDLFMMYSFFVVAAILFTHGTLYYFREPEHEEGGEDEHDEQKSAKKAEGSHRSSKVADAPAASDHQIRVGSTEVELSPSAPPRKESYHANKGVRPHPKVKPDGTYHWIADFSSIPAWYHSLVYTRQIDVIAVPTFCLVYAIGVAFIFGRPY